MPNLKELEALRDMETLCSAPSRPIESRPDYRPSPNAAMRAMAAVTGFNPFDVWASVLLTVLAVALSGFSLSVAWGLIK